MTISLEFAASVTQTQTLLELRDVVLKHDVSDFRRQLFMLVHRGTAIN